MAFYNLAWSRFLEQSNKYMLSVKIGLHLNNFQVAKLRKFKVFSKNKPLMWTVKRKSSKKPFLADLDALY